MRLLSKNKGVTLIELLTGIAIFGILMAVAVPSYRAVTQNQKGSTLSREFTSGLVLARSEAIKRGESVTLCASNADQTACGGAGDWSNGWIVFSDPDGDGSWAAANDRLQISDPLSDGASLTGPAARVTFLSTGVPQVGAGTYSMSASGCVGNNGRQVVVSTAGWPSVRMAACS